jgi:hypothetical protein
LRERKAAIVEGQGRITDFRSRNKLPPPGNLFVKEPWMVAVYRIDSCGITPAMPVRQERDLLLIAKDMVEP